jgi:hypothetical protein
MVFCKCRTWQYCGKLQPRNINVSFTKNCNVAVDLLIFTFYSDQLVVDVETDVMSRGLGWRIHESVEDTKLSTNKQHSP